MLNLAVGCKNNKIFTFVLMRLFEIVLLLLFGDCVGSLRVESVECMGWLGVGWESVGWRLGGGWR